MATIENQGPTSPAAFRAEISSMDDGQLMAQDLVQQGAINAVSWLLANGCTEQLAAQMVASLRENGRLVREEAIRRGKPGLFDRDQTVYQ